MTEKFKVVISGISGRFPDSGDVDSFKTKLYNGYDFVTTNNRKWPVGYKHKLFEEKEIPDPTGKLPDDHKKFDFTVFKMSKSWIEGCDILNRLILEPSFEAVVDAGINPYSLGGSKVGVFIAAGKNDIDYRLLRREVHSNTVMPGFAKSMLANRISYALNLEGTSFTSYSDVHGGLDILAMAYRYVSDGFGEAAIVGAVSSIIDPRTSIEYAQTGFLSPDGITCPFDESANGYARSECVVCFYLQRAEDAQRNYGDIKFCGASYLGCELPSFIGYDEKYLKMSWHHLVEVNESAFDPSDIAYVEMNAFGLKFTDKIESNAVAEWFRRNEKKPLMVGSVKSNVGHTEEVAGLIAVLKALLAVNSGILPLNLHLKKLNKDIKAFEENWLQVVAENTPLPGNMVAVNSCSLFGSVGLAVIQQHENSVNTLPPDEICPRILLLCGREEVKLMSKLKMIANMPCTPEFIALTNNAFQQDMPLHIFRGFTLLPTVLQSTIGVGEKGDANRPVWFIFTGMGSQWNGMGRDLLNLPLFAETVANCDRILRTKNIDIYEVLTSDDPTLFDDITNAFVGIITVQIGLYEILKALGIQPDGIIGHSTGEIGCAYADGCATLEEVVLASWARGRASIKAKTIKGMMAAVGENYAKMKDKLPEDIQVACHNSADNCTISGPAESVNAYVKSLREEGIFAKVVNVANIAYHSKYIELIGFELLHLMKQIIREPKKRSSKWISTSYPEREWNLSSAQYFTPEYATHNLLSPVLLEEGCKHIPENAICIEIAPHGLLQAILKRSLPPTCTHIPLTNRAQNKVNNLNFLLSSIGKLYIAGLEPQVNNIFPKVEYPVPRGTPSLSPYCTWYHSDDPLPQHIMPHVDVNPTLSSEQIPICIRCDSDYLYLKDHRIHGNITIPPSFFMYLTWKAFSLVRKEELGSSSIIFEDVKIHNNVIMKTQDLKYASIMIQYGTGNFEVILRDQEDSEDFQVILTGSINLMLEKTMNSPHLSDNQNTQDLIPKSHFYYVFKRAGYSLGEEFCLINDLRHHDTGYETTVTWNGNWVAFLDALMKFQMFANHEKNVKGVFPYRLQRLELQANRFSSLKRGTALICTIDTITNELFCDGMRIHALKYKMHTNPEIKQLRGFRFISYQNPQCQNIHEFLDLCIQIAVESANSFGHLVVLDLTMQYSKIIKQIIDGHDFPESIVVLHSARGFFHASSCRPTFIITDRIEDLETLDAWATDTFMLYIFPSDFSFHVRDQTGQCFIEITSQSFFANTFTLLKTNFNRGHYKTAKLYFFQDQKEEMKSRLNGTIDETKPYFVVRNDIEYEDISTIVKLRKHYSNARYLLLMDEVQRGKELYDLIQKGMSMDLPLSILHCGVWSSYRHINSKNGNVINTHRQSNMRAGLEEINYVCGPNGKLQSVWIKQFDGVSFASFINDAVKRIGLAQTSETGELLYDPHLFWTAPRNWSLEEAVRVPYFYAQAYNLLNPPHGNRCTIETVMINVGNEHLLADALITLALYKNQTVFVTVSSNDEAVLLQQKFPRLALQNIFHIQNYEFQLHLQMKGEGVHLVINCLPGIQHVEACLRCTGRFGHYTEVGQANCSDSLSAGLFSFQKCISLHVIQHKVTDLLKLPVDIKIRMKTFLEESINKGVVVPPEIPLQNILSTVSPTPLKMVTCQSEREILSSGSQLLKYDCNHSYMIVGTSMEDGLWFDVVEWLTLQGARKFSIALEERSLPPTYHPIRRLLFQKNLQILFISASRLEDKREANSFIMETEEFGPLEAIFFVSIKRIGKKLANLDCLVTPNVHIVGLNSSGLKEFEYRKARGSTAILIHHENNDDNNKSNNISTILPQLNEMLLQNDCNNNKTSVLYHAMYATSTNVVRRNLYDYLPYDYGTLAMIGQNEEDELCFVEMCSLSRKYAHCKNVYPIFIFPAVHRITLQPLISQLLQPVFTAMSTPIASVKYAAHELYQSLKKIQRLGPITMICETWTLTLALEVASHARSDNRKYKIFVLDGNPKMWSEHVVYLRRASNLRQFKTTYADEILHFRNDKEDKFKIDARNEVNDGKTIKYVIRAVEIVQTKLDELARMHFTDGLLENVTFFERHQSVEGVFDNLSVTSEIIVLNEPNYRNLLMNQKVSKTINENSLFSWWLHSVSNDAR